MRAVLGATTPEGVRSTSRRWRVLATCEVALAVVVVVLVPVLPSLLLLVLMTISLLLRRQHLESLGLRRVPQVGRMALRVLALTAAWTLFTVTVTLPVLEHLSGQRQDVSQFDELQGNVGTTVLLIILSWTLAAIGETLAFLGYVQTRMRELLPARPAGLVVAVATSCLVFGLIHTEQGFVGVAVSAVDAAFFSFLRYHYRTLWAAVLAHGFGNTIGLVTYFLVGPVYALW